MAVLFLVGTGDGSKIVEAEIVVVGDLNSDEYVNADDMNILSKYLVGDESSTGTDVNGDTAVDARDLIRYRRYLAEASETLSGKGTETEPYLISSLADMYRFLSDSQNSESAGKYYQITEDMVVNVGDATSLDPTKALVRKWNTIGISGTPFAGTLNGNGNTISGIYLSNATDLTNLLGWVDVDAGTVTGLHVSSSYINPTFSDTTSVKYTGDVINSEIPACEASITTGADTVFYKEFTDAMTVANGDTESEMVDVVVLNDVKLSARVDVVRDITIKNASGKTVTIARDSGLADLNMFYSNQNVKFGLKVQRNGDSGSLIIDAKNISTKGSVVQIAHKSGEFYLGDYVTIKNAKNPNGGALRNAGIAVLEGNMIDNVTTRAGGAIYNEGTLTINKGTYSGNQCANNNDGGGVIYNKGTVTINGGMFSGNKDTVNGGGVIYNTNIVTINGGTFSDNTGTTKGAVINSGAGTVTITGGTFSGNTVTGEGGGAIYNSGTSVMSISGVNFSGNNALYGGAIYNLSSADMTIANTTFTGNGAALINNTKITGGAIYHEGGIMTITECTFTGNGGERIGELGGAIYSKSTERVRISGGTFSGNGAYTGGGAICVEAGNVALDGVKMERNITRSTESAGGGALYLRADATASIRNGASISNNVNGAVASNVARTVDISFANDGTCTLYLLDDTFTKGYLGCYLTGATGNSNNKYVLREGIECAIPYNQYCKVNYTKNTAGDATDAPDYSDSVHELNIYAHRSTSNGTFVDLDGTKLDYGDYRTKERFQEYKDCGFNVLYIQENNYNGEPFETSDTKKCLDLAEEVGLKCIIIDERIRELSRSKVSLIGGADFATLYDLANQMRIFMAPYIDHPAFYGLATVDEPEYLQLQATCEVYKALKMVDEDIYVKTTLSPFKQSNSVLYYTGKDDIISSLIPTSFNHYKTYIEKYLQESGTGLLSYDDYPFRTDSFLTTYFRNLQYAVTAAAAQGADVELVVQSFAHANTRLPDLNELYLQNNAALAFGVKNLGYFTYWRAGGDTMTGGILDYDGSKMIYDEVQEVIAYTRKMANVMLNFDYEKAYVTYDSANSKPDFFANVDSQNLDKLTVGPVSQPTIVTQMKDETNNRTGYMVVNVQSSVEGFSEPEVVTLNFEGYEYATYYIGDESKTVLLQDGKFKFVLAEGEGVFVIPHN